MAFGESIFLFVAVCCFDRAGKKRELLFAWLCSSAPAPNSISAFVVIEANKEQKNIFIRVILSFSPNELLFRKMPLL